MPITIDVEQNDGVSIDCFKTRDNDDDIEGRESDVEGVNEYNDTLYEGDDRYVSFSVTILV